MTTRRPHRYPNPLRASLLGFPAAFFLAGVATDAAYLRTSEIQWTNFSAWMITGGLVFGALLLIWALIELVFARRGLLHFALLLLACLLGLINAFQHSRDGWSSVGTVGLTLSALCAVLALGAAVIRLSGGREIVR